MLRLRPRGGCFETPARAGSAGIDNGDLARAGVSKHPPRGRRWRIRRGLFPPDFFPGSDRCQVRRPHGPSRRRALPIRSECRELESFLEPPEAHAVRQRDLFARNPARTTLREITVEALLHLIVENDAEISASLPLDLLRGFLIEPVEIGIVVGFAGFGESVVENLTLSGALRIGEKTMAVLGEGEQLARTVRSRIRDPRRPRAGR